MKKTLEALHQAAQYLASAGISFVDHKEDDSHTNLGWDVKNRRLLTHCFSAEKYQLSLAVISGSLEWLKNGKLEDTLKLSESNHLDTLSWIKSQAKERGLASYKNELHYDLPYAALSNDHVFRFDADEVNLITAHWDIGQKAFAEFLADWRYDSPIRIWPHHFDLGFYVRLDKAGTLFLGGGLAVPDSLVDDLYFYTNGWKNGDAVKTNSFATIDIGEWRSDWDGATLPASNMNINLVTLFLKLTQQVYLDQNKS
jgi:hypothetical protein